MLPHAAPAATPDLNGAASLGAAAWAHGIAGLRPDLAAPLADVVGPSARFGCRTEQFRRYVEAHPFSLYDI
jgi:hypothetical protein